MVNSLGGCHNSLAGGRVNRVVIMAKAQETVGTAKPVAFSRVTDMGAFLNKGKFHV
jgi:hypothetical protein